MRDNPTPNLKRCYEILEIPAGAPLDEVRQAFRDLVSIWHPDKYRHNSRLMEKADQKLKEINRAWEQIQAFSREQERIEEERRQQQQEEAEKKRQEGRNSLIRLVDLRQTDLEITSTVSADHARQAYRTLLNRSRPYDPDPGLKKQETVQIPSEPDNPESSREEAATALLKEAVATYVHRSLDERDSRMHSGPPPEVTVQNSTSEPHSETTKEISRKMTLLSEYYVQGRREKELLERQERERNKRALAENEEKNRHEQKQKHRIFTERYLDRYRAWLAEELEKFHAAEQEKQRKSGIYKIFRGVEKQKEFPFGIPLIQMVFIQGGLYAMGRDDKGSLMTKVIGHANSHPRHMVSISNFYLSKYPVTEKQWSRAMGIETPEHGHNLPVLLCWSDIQKFIGKLNGITGLSFRLPTEAEWEYAARSGGVDEKWPDENEGSSIFEHASVGRGHVGLFQPNGLGLYDMLGNVGEWTADWYDPKYYAVSPEPDPAGPDRGDRKVIRGNVYIDAVGNPMISDSFSRNFLPVNRFNRAGFRLAHSLL